MGEGGGSKIRKNCQRHLWMVPIEKRLNIFSYDNFRIQFEFSDSIFGNGVLLKFSISTIKFLGCKKSIQTLKRL